MRYPGGKGQAGVYQKIINLMPPHDVYIETHLGGGNILERKKPARSNIAIDIDGAVCDRWSTSTREKNDALRGWYRTDFPRLDRGGTWALESLWLNFDPPARLHDFSYLGGNFRERERIKRKRARWRARLEQLPASERLAMLQVLLELASPEAASGAGVDPVAISDEGARDGR